MTIFNNTYKSHFLAGVILLVLCTTNSFADVQWLNPLPHGNPLYEIWGSSNNDVFAISIAGNIIHYNGVDWQIQQSNTTNSLSGICGFSSDSVFVVGEKGTLLHYNGSIWSSLPFINESYLTSIWGLSENDLYIGNSEGQIFRWDGSSWTDMQTGLMSQINRINDIWGTNSNDIFAASRSNLIHWDGSSWSKFSNSDIPIGIWGTSSDNVYAVTIYNRIFHWDGDNWSPIISFPYIYLRYIWGTGTDDIFVAAHDSSGYPGNPCILHFDGTEWHQINSEEDGLLDFHGMWGFSSNDIFICGDRGSVFHYDGVSISESTTGKKNENSVSCVKGFDEENIYFGGHESFYHWDGTTLTDLYSEDTPSDIDHLLPFANDCVYAIFYYDTNIYFWNGSNWSIVFTLPTEYQYERFSDLWGDNKNDIWVVGSHDMIVHYDGISWSIINDPIQNYRMFRTIWGASENSIYAGGTSNSSYETAIIKHWNGNEWTDLSDAWIESLDCLWGVSSKAMYAIGHHKSTNYTSILTWDGAYNWNPLYVLPVDPDSEDIYCISGSSKDDVYFAGAVNASISLIYHWDGSALTEVQPFCYYSIRDIYRTTDNIYYIVGAYGSIIKWKPSEPLCTELSLEITMPKKEFHPGDIFSCSVSMCNPGPGPLGGCPLIVILEVYGSYYFPPSFSTDFTTYLSLYPEIPLGETKVSVLDPFPWPSGTGSYSGAMWYAAITDPGVTTLVSDLSTWEFGWSE